MKDNPYRFLTVNFVVSAFTIAMGINLIGTGISQKIYYIASYISILLLLIEVFKKEFTLRNSGNIKILAPFLAIILLLGVIFIIWSYHLKMMVAVTAGSVDHNSEQIIKSYYVSGTRLLLSSLAILFVVKNNHLISDKTILLGKIVLTVCLCIAVKDGWGEYHALHFIRIKLYTPAASIFSYMVIFLYCAYLSLSMLNYGKLSIVWDMLVTILVGCLLLMADTRISQLAFISVILLYLLINPAIRQKISLKRVLSVGLLIMLLMGGLTAKRWQEGVNDIKSFDQNSSSSLGARVAIWHAAWFFIKSHHGFSSPSERTEQARQYIAKYYPNNHEGYNNSQYNMHNEILEIMSLFGIAGIVVLLLFYLSAVWMIVRYKLGAGALLTIVSLFICGLSDSVLWYHQSVLVLVLALIISFIGEKHRPVLAGCHDSSQA